MLANRVPAFERIKPGAAWAGYYDMCAWDENVLLGALPEQPNFLLANGFSCRGHCEEATGRRGLHVAEILLRSLDGTALSPTEVA